LRTVWAAAAKIVSGIQSHAGTIIG